MDKFTLTHLDNWLENQFQYDEDRQAAAREKIIKVVAESDDVEYLLNQGWDYILKQTDFWTTEFNYEIEYF